MTEFIVRTLHKCDETARREIVDVATLELRRIYRQCESNHRCGSAPNGVLVALKNNTVVGTAEYVQKDDSLYIQGVAVHPNHRGCGVCRALLGKAEEIAKSEKLPVLTLCAIEETGNVELFKKLGFKVTSSDIASNYVSPVGGPVTQVNMERAIP